MMEEIQICYHVAFPELAEWPEIMEKDPEFEGDYDADLILDLTVGLRDVAELNVTR